MPSSTGYSQARTHRRIFPFGWPVVFISLCVLPVAVFLALPWSIEGKSLAVLHGLCAQQPGHTFYFGESRLPFDARMTGIYSGFAVASLYLLALGRWRRGGLPSLGVAALLGIFVVVLGIDGVNSTLLDMNLWHLYTPMNELRLITGLLTGVALAAFIWLLLGQVSFQHSDRTLRPVIDGYRDVALILVLLGIYAALVLTGWEPLRLPLTAFLIVSAVCVLTGLSLAFVLLIGRRENQARTLSDLAAPATAALLIAFTVLGLTSGGRFLLEAFYGISTTVT
jgi:uncharacterized membrane protein